MKAVWSVRAVGRQGIQRGMVPALARPRSLLRRYASVEVNSAADAETAASDEAPLDTATAGATVDWSTSFHGLSQQPFPKDVASVLLAPTDVEDIEIKPGETPYPAAALTSDGIIFLPEIKYRRILNRAFGPGGWGLAPRGDFIITERSVSREYALVCHGRLVSVARGEQEYFDPHGVSTAMEGCKSNALMRNCKDLGIASELWDPRFIREFKAGKCVEVWGEHTATKKRRKLWRRRDDPPLSYPYKET